MRYKAIVSYDGTNYAGWQKQNNQLSIQEVIENALFKLTQTEINVTAAGRTDSKVHADNQVFHFDTDKQFKDFKHSLNSQLPPDIYVKSIQQVKDDFHARFDATKKEYIYKINMGEYNPILNNHVNQLCQSLDILKMQQASSIFIGEHDFTSFNATTLEEMPNQIRTIYSIEFEQKEDLLLIHVIGNGFLRHMVRMIVGSLIQVGLGKKSKADLEKTLQQKDKTANHYNAEAQGLYLHKIWYD